MTRQERAAWAFVAPVLVVTLLVLVVPTAGALLLSVTDFDIYALADLGDLRWVGAGNYAGLAGDPLFWRALANTALFTLLGVPAAIGASLGAALLLDAASARLRPLWRVVLFAPYVTTVVASALVFRYLLNGRSGLLNYALGRIGVAPVDWLGDPRFSIPAVVLFVVWKVFGYNMVIFSAALGLVPRDLHEAAMLDGAGGWTRFRHVVLPSIGPVLLLAVLQSVANFLQIFTEPYVMTHGGPAQSTVTILYFMFNEGFAWWNLGLASAVALVLFALILLLTAAQVRLGRRREWL